MSRDAEAAPDMGAAVMAEADALDRRLQPNLLHGDAALGLVAFGFMLGRWMGRTGRSNATVGKVIQAIALGRIAGQRGR